MINLAYKRETELNKANGEITRNLHDCGLPPQSHFSEALWEEVPICDLHYCVSNADHNFCHIIGTW